MSRLLYRWGRWSATRPWIAIGAWVLLSVLVVIIGMLFLFGDKLAWLRLGRLPGDISWSNKTGSVRIYIPLMTGLLLSLLLSLILYSVCAVDWLNVSPQLQKGGVAEGRNLPEEGNTTRPLGLSFLGARPDKDLGVTRESLSAGYLLPFEIVSIHLLVVLIGAAYLARAKRRQRPHGLTTEAPLMGRGDTP